MGCFKSKSAVKRASRLSRSSDVYSTPEFGACSLPGKMSNQELDDVKTILYTLRTEQLDLVVISYMYDKLFQAHPDIKQIFIDAAFLDPDHTLGCTSDPWFQGFLRAYFNAVIKYILLQADEGQLREFLEDLRENHQRINGIEKFHLELMMQYLYTGFVHTLGSSIDHRKRSALEHLLTLLYHDALIFLPLRADKNSASVPAEVNNSRPGSTAISRNPVETRGHKM